MLFVIGCPSSTCQASREWFNTTHRVTRSSFYPPVPNRPLIDFSPLHVPQRLLMAASSTLHQTRTCHVATRRARHLSSFSPLQFTYLLNILIFNSFELLLQTINILLTKSAPLFRFLSHFCIFPSLSLFKDSALSFSLGKQNLTPLINHISEPVFHHSNPDFFHFHSRTRSFVHQPRLPLIFIHNAHQSWSCISSQVNTTQSPIIVE